MTFRAIPGSVAAAPAISCAWSVNSDRALAARPLAPNRAALSTPRIGSEVTNRMASVAQVAKKFNEPMSRRRPCMDGELAKIRGWLNA